MAGKCYALVVDDRDMVVVVTRDYEAAVRAASDLNSHKGVAMWMTPCRVVMRQCGERPSVGLQLPN